MQDWRRVPQELKGHTDRVKSVVFSPDGRRLASASDDHTARVWYAVTGVSLRELKGHTGCVSQLHFPQMGVISLLPHGMAVCVHGTRCAIDTISRMVVILPRSQRITLCVWDAVTGASSRGTLIGWDQLYPPRWPSSRLCLCR